MATRVNAERSQAWIGDDADGGEAFAGGRMWIGRHTADGDILVFDPEVSDPAATNVSLFSLSQLRHKLFSRAVVETKIDEVTDEEQHARAIEDYRKWPVLKEERERERVAAQAEAAQRLRQGTLDRHREFMEERGVPYEGVVGTTDGRKSGGARRRRTRCHACGIALDDFASAECRVCNGVLCSCGACGCAAPGKQR